MLCVFQPDERHRATTRRALRGHGYLQCVPRGAGVAMVAMATGRGPMGLVGSGVRSIACMSSLWVKEWVFWPLEAILDHIPTNSSCS
jgi:hypothetical protein